MTPEQLAEIEARAEAATPGPWAYTVDGDSDDYTSWDWPQDIISKSKSFERYPKSYPGKQYHCIVADMSEAKGIKVEEGFMNAEFIAHARTDIPALIAEVRRLQAALRAVGAEVEEEGWPY